MPLIYRAMRRDFRDGKPLVGDSAATLGVRLPPDKHFDIPVEADGTVMPLTKGMSVAPNWRSLPRHRIQFELVFQCAARSPERPDGQQRLRHRGDRAGRVRAVRARRRRRSWCAVAADGSGAARLVRRLRRRARVHGQLATAAAALACDDDLVACGPRLRAIWKQFAERYRDSSNRLLFEPLNEPHGNLSAVAWNKMLRDVNHWLMDDVCSVAS